mmetsp:Transcript_27087/g.59906  ORF Transcript_27087/g.59906 Transcript_27087/m.59906 type:complete len:378 (+) Transcript_27087:182-1315(+)
MPYSDGYTYGIHVYRIRIVLHVLVRRPPRHLGQVLLGGDGVHVPAVVAHKHLGGDLHLRVLGDQLGGDGHTVDDLDAGVHDGVVFHITHRDKIVDLGDAQPVQRVRHHGLETRVCDAGHVAGAVEVLGGGVPALSPLAHVVHEVLGDLAEGPALFAEVHAHTAAAPLCGADALLDGVRQVGSAGADVGPEHVGAVALVVHAHGKLHLLVRDCVRVAPDVDGESANGGQEKLDVGARQQLGVHHVGFLEQSLAQGLLRAAEALRHAGQEPYRLDGGLGHHGLAVSLQDLAVRRDAPHAQGILHLGEVDVRLGDCDGGADVVSLVEVGPEGGVHQVPPGINRHDLFGVFPAPKGPEVVRGGGHLQVRYVVRVELAGGHG